MSHALPAPLRRQLRNQLTKLSTKYGTHTATDIYVKKREHTKLFSRKHYRFLQETACFLELSTAMIHCQTAEKKSIGQLQALQLTLLTENLQYIVSACQHISEGSYTAGIILSRTAYEAFIRFLYTCYYPDSIPALLSRKPARQPFNLTKFLKKDLHVNWNHYLFSSAITHANQYGTLSTLLGRNMQPIHDTTGYEQQLCESAMNHADFIMVGFLHALLYTIQRTCSDSLRLDVQKLLTIRHTAMRAHPQNYWPCVSVDMENLFRFLPLINNNRSWKKAWHRFQKEYRHANRIIKI